MAATKPKKATNTLEHTPLEVEGKARPRLHKLVVRNFRSIGPTPVEIELDDIVVLVGPNNAGKSSILRAYEIVMSHGSKDGKLVAADFSEGIVDPSRFPQIELQTVIFHDAPGKRWISKLPSGESLVRELWTWESPNKDPIRRGFDVDKGDWDDEVPWGAPNVANSRRPQAHRIDAFQHPDEQAKAIADVVLSILKDRIAQVKSDPDAKRSDYDLVIDRIRELQAKVAAETEGEVQKIESEISAYLERIFPQHRVKVDARAETDVEKTYSPFKSNPDVLMGAEGGYFSTIANQGSGARRTLLWATLKYLKERADGSDARPHVLLLDEPEICLHPSAVREARAVLYSLPLAAPWQVMITSHSPLFIDLSQDNTTVVRVSRDQYSAVQATTLYRPARARLSEDDKRNMKLLNLCDPYLHEFFFGGRQVVVEGDTEFTAFGYIREMFPADYADVQVIRARGKGVIPSVARVLLQFSKDFSILHDTDSPKTSTGKANPAWGMNKSIKEVLSLDNAAGAVHLVACKTSFEVALFGEEARDEKPYSALERIRTDDSARDRVKALFDGLLDSSKLLPTNCIRWTKIEDLA